MTIHIKNKLFTDVYSRSQSATLAIKQIDKDLNRGFQIVMDGVTYANNSKTKNGKKFHNDLSQKNLSTSQVHAIMNIAHQGLFAPLHLQGHEIASESESAEWRQNKPAATIVISTQSEKITVSSEIEATIGRLDLDAEDINTLIPIAKYKARVEANLTQNTVLVTHEQQGIAKTRSPISRPTYSERVSPLAKLFATVL